MQYLTTNKIACDALLATPLSALSARAQSDADLISASADYDDLAINRPDGTKVLLDYIKRATAQACPGEPENRLLRQHARFVQRRKTAGELPLSQAVATAAATSATPDAGLPASERATAHRAPKWRADCGDRTCHAGRIARPRVSKLDRGNR